VDRHQCRKGVARADDAQVPREDRRAQGFRNSDVRGDGTLAQTTLLTMDATVFVPTSLSAPTCAQLEQEIGRHGVRSAACTDDVAGACACDFTRSSKMATTS